MMPRSAKEGAEMAADWAGAKRRWAASAAGAVLVGIVAVMLLRVPRLAPPVNDRTAPPPRARLVEIARAGGADKTLNDEAVMHDQAPLFVPTPRNVTFRPPSPPEAGQTVLDLDDKRYSFGEAELKLNLPPAKTVPTTPGEVIAMENSSAPLYGLGRADRGIAPLPPRGAVVEVRASGSNRRVLVATLGPDAKPPTERPWRPLEFLVCLDAAGLVGLPVLTEGSDVGEVDKFFRNYLAQTFRVGERLPPGFYRILVGP
jgi:hypothetical protein